MKVYVNVTDVNDNEPYFKVKAYRTNVRVDANIGDFVLAVSKRYTPPLFIITNFSYISCSIIIHSLVLSRLDYVNSLYNRLPKCRTDKIIRSSIRTIHNIKFNDHISIISLQHKLQILSLKDRAFLKSVSLVHNLIYSNAYNILF